MNNSAQTPFRTKNRQAVSCCLWTSWGMAAVQ